MAFAKNHMETPTPTPSDHPVRRAWEELSYTELDTGCTCQLQQERLLPSGAWSQRNSIPLPDKSGISGQGITNRYRRRVGGAGGCRAVKMRLGAPSPRQMGGGGSTERGSHDQRHVFTQTTSLKAGRAVAWEKLTQ